MKARYLDLQELPGADQVPLYGSRQWLECASSATPFPLKVLGLEENGVLVSYLPYLESARGPWIRALPLYLDTTSGPYFLFPQGLAFAERSRWMRTVQESLFRELANHVHFATLFPLLSDPRALPGPTWETSIRSTARLDLTLDSPPWSSQALRKLHKAENKGLRLSHNENIDTLYEAIASVQTRHNLEQSTLSVKATSDLAQKLLQHKLVDIWCVTTSENQQVAYGIIALDLYSDTVRFLYNVNTTLGLKLYASDFLFHGIAQAYRGKFHWFDLCGTDHTNLMDFKEKWASETQHSFRYDYTRSSLHQSALKLFSRLRRQR